MKAPNVTLNALEVHLSAEKFTAWTAPLPADADFKVFRSEMEPEWFVRRSGAEVDAMPWQPAPARVFGTRTTFQFAEKPQFTAALFIAQLRRWLLARYPKGRIFGHRPVTLVPARDEVVSSVLNSLQTVPARTRGVVAQFRIWRQFEFDARLIEARPGATQIALAISPSTRWEIRAPVDLLVRHGVDVRGLMVVRREPQPDERRLLGRIGRLDGPRVLLSEAYDERTEVDADKVWLEGSRANFAHCLRTLLDETFDDFEAERRLQEAELLSASAFRDKLAGIAGTLREASPLRLGPDLHAKIGGVLAIRNTPEFRSVVPFPPVEYCYNRALTQRHTIAWAGLESHGPYAPPTDRSPHIVAFCPDHLQADLEVFLRRLRDGVGSVRTPRFARGFASAMDLLNPSFEIENISWLRERSRAPVERYREAIDRYLASHRTALPHLAIVVIPDDEARRPPAESPYLHAKAMLLTAGVPVQAVRETTLRQRPYDLQYTLQDFSVSLFAKLQGIPWTVDPQLTITDEIVIGLGSCELTGSRVQPRQRFVGITTVFSGDGTYLLADLARECTFDEYPERVREALTSTLHEIRRRNGWKHGDTVRIVVHSFKPFRIDEVEEIVKHCVATLQDEQRVQYAFLTVSTDHAFALFDPDQVGVQDPRGQVRGVLVPERGTCVRIGENTRLISVRGPNMVKEATAPLPRPLLVHLHPSSNFRSLDRLAEQVLRFTSLSWRSTRPAREPVTIVYSELLARQLARLGAVPGWKLEAVNRVLRSTCWFL
jgi:hypothetical protein